MASETDLSKQKGMGIIRIKNPYKEESNFQYHKIADNVSQKSQDLHLKANQKLEKFMKKQLLNDKEPLNQIKLLKTIEKEQNQLSQEELKIMMNQDEQIKTLPFLDIKIKEEYYQRKIEYRNKKQQLKQLYQVLKLQNELLEQENEELQLKKKLLEQEHEALKLQEEQYKNQFKQGQQQQQIYIGITFKKTKVLSEDNLECSICSQEFKNGEKLALLNCIHRFHQKCFKQWREKSNQCPYCQYRI
ncbi:unnamed protein product [Paramecium octaurelia]|uniref:RING-type domain-containing protein n=1 Tax=Paramecium octaurelia TaxID=43137 RepID=A0A8S1YCD2_PAROT|nr:unnamed protein product [Paramecium octaurelia]